MSLCKETPSERNVHDATVFAFFVVYTETKINCNILKNLHFEIILKNISRYSGTSGQLMVEGKP